MSIKTVKEHLSIIAPDLEISEFKESTATVEQAANAHNVEKGQIVKTIALIIEKPILLMTSGDVKIDNKTISKMSFDTPCEISDTVLMASSEDICLALKEKISNHDHD